MASLSNAFRLHKAPGTKQNNVNTKMNKPNLKQHQKVQKKVQKQTKDANQIRFKFKQTSTKKADGEDKVNFGGKEYTMVDHKMTSNLSGKKEENTLYRNLQANATRFSDGQTAYFYDILSPYLEKKFATEAMSDFTDFQKSTPEATSEESPYINQQDLADGMKNNNWSLDGFSAEDYMTIYTVGYQDRRMHLREFIFMEIEFISKRITTDPEQKPGDGHCLLETQKKIKDLFIQADCQKSGEINSEQLYEAIKKIKKTRMQSGSEIEDNRYVVSTGQVNAFFLKIMEVTTATINIKEFTYALLCGYMERMFNPDGTVQVDALQNLMKLRKIRAVNGEAPE